MYNRVSSPMCFKNPDGALVDACLVTKPLRLKKNTLKIDCWLNGLHNFIFVITNVWRDSLPKWPIVLSNVVPWKTLTRNTMFQPYIQHHVPCLAMYALPIYVLALSANISPTLSKVMHRSRPRPVVIMVFPVRILNSGDCSIGQIWLEMPNNI